MSDETLTEQGDAISEWQSTPAHDAGRQYEASRKQVRRQEGRSRREWTLGTRPPLRLPQIEKAIDDAFSITYLPEDWDDSGAKRILEQTWQRAGNALRRIARTAQRRYRYSMPAPSIGPCANGSIDLYWNDPRFTLLINIKESHEHGSDYYWEHQGSKSEGPFNPESPDLSFLGSLAKL
jgi:hypothetical protein